MSLDCDNVCENLRFLAYSKNRQSHCSDALQIRLTELRDLLKHCGNFCCPTVSTLSTAAGGGVCVVIGSQAPVNKTIVYRSRDGIFVNENDVPTTEGVVDAAGDPGPLIGNFTNPFDTKALLVIDCIGYAEVDTYIPHEQQRRSMMFTFSETLNQSVPLYYNPDTERAIKFSGDPSRLFLAVNDVQASAFKYELGYDRGISIDSASGQIQMFLDPGETKTIYGQWFAYFLNGETGTDKFSTLHGDMQMRALIFPNAIDNG